MEFKWLGCVSFQEGEQQQQRDFARVKQSEIPALILGLEHKPVITLGVRGNQEDDLNSEQVELAQQGIDLAHIDRGGQATLHSPGQLVVYPIVNLRHLGLTVRQFINCLQESTIYCLKHFGIQCWSGKIEPGVYTESGKIAFVGIRVSQGISRHGISINVCNDLSLFALIRSCGVTNQKLDSIINYNTVTSPKQVFDVWTGYFVSALELVRSPSPAR